MWPREGKARESSQGEQQAGRARGRWEHGLENSWKIWALSSREKLETSGRALQGRAGRETKHCPLKSE